MRVISAIWIAASLIATPPFARAATPITACGTVITKSGSYVVTKNLTVKKGSTTACIAVNTDYVTIDLGGFTIDCGGEDVLGAYRYLDLTPKGRNETGPCRNMHDWLRHHDRYDDGSADATGVLPGRQPCGAGETN